MAQFVLTKLNDHMELEISKCNSSYSFHPTSTNFMRILTTVTLVVYRPLHFLAMGQVLSVFVVLYLDILGRDIPCSSINMNMSHC